MAYREQYFDCAKQAAVLGSNAILLTRNETLIEKVQLKADGTPLSLADKASEREIVNYLIWHCPHEHILSEESEEKNFDWSKGWVVDPLDGTAEYLVNRRGYAVNVAYIIDHQPFCGAMCFPARAVMVKAAQGSSCWIDDLLINNLCEGKSLREVRIGLDLAPTVPTAIILKYVEPLRLAGGYALNHPSSQSILDLLLEHTGAYFSSNQSVWDVAAGDIALREAGGCVFRPDGEPVTYNKIRMGPTFRTANEALKAEVLALYNK